MSRILIVEDNAAVRDIVEVTLAQEGLETEAVSDGEVALERLRGAEQPYDLVVLDVMLPGIDGITVCRELREQDDDQSKVPVIMLTARDDETSVVVGLEVGADDYVTKPFRPRELASRVRAHLRRNRLSSRASDGEQQKFSFPGLKVDLLRRQVISHGESIELTAKEFDVLAFLAAHPGRVYTREQIMRHLWEGEFFGEKRAADVHILNLRKKIEPDPQNPHYIQTVRGVGYRFVHPPEEPAAHRQVPAG